MFSQHPELQNAELMALLQSVGIADPRMLNNSPLIEMLLKQ